ncbi:MAG: FG-GAP repeat domain-containing protein, partial [Terriglobia bacterium]
MEQNRISWKALLASSLLLAGLLGVFSLAAQATGSNPVPFVSAISPVSAAPGGTQFTLTVMGAGFISGSTVDWNGAALSTTYVSAVKLTATVPASDITANGVGWITVVSPASGGGTSNLLFLPITGSSASIALTPSSYAVGRFPYSISTGDFDGDGKLDIAIPNVNDNTVSLLLGNGDGTFQTQKTTG